MSEPKLRFKEYEGPWEITILGEILKERSEITNDDIPTYSLTIENGVTPKTDRYEREHLVSDKDSAYKLVMQNDFAFNPMNLRFGAIGKHSEKHPVKVSKYYNIFYCNPSANHSFFEAYFRTGKMISFYDKMSTGSLAEKKRVHFSDFLKFQIPVPTYQEQTKIADFLTVVDEKITQLTQKFNLLALYKKGVMQKIFNQELRFKDDDGREFSEWKTVRFGEIFSFKSTNSYSRECLNYVSGAVKNIHYGDIHTKFKSRFNINNERVPFINENIDLTKLNPDYFCVEGDLVIADASEDYKDIGKCIEIESLDNQTVIAGLHTFLARPSLGVLSRGFMSHAMQSEKIRLQIMTIAQGTKVLSISTGRLSKIGIPLPEKEEQTKIANFLTAIDDKITKTQAELDAVKQYKQGLLQQMFV